MKIEKIEGLALDAKIDKPFSIATTTFTAVRALIVRITTDSGLVGIGESVVRSAPRATKYIVEDMLAPLIIGKDPMDAGGLWWEMFSAMRVRGHTKGHFVEALSGVDVALWDIIGKAQSMPTYKALHGFGRKRLPAYGSSVFNDTPDRMAAQALRFVAKGYPAVKIKLGMGLREDLAAIKAIREAVGEEIALMVDVNSRYDAASAVVLGRRLEPYAIDWLEEPVPPYDLKGYRQVKQGQAIPLAGGEGEFCLGMVSGTSWRPEPSIWLNRISEGSAVLPRGCGLRRWCRPTTFSSRRTPGCSRRSTWWWPCTLPPPPRAFGFSNSWSWTTP